MKANVKKKDASGDNLNIIKEDEKSRALNNKTGSEA